MNLPCAICVFSFSIDLVKCYVNLVLTVSDTSRTVVLKGVQSAPCSLNIVYSLGHWNNVAGEGHFMQQG